jgi:predicted O-methyltransferase YrrM
MALVTDRIAQLDVGSRSHVAGSFATSVLRRLEELLPADIQNTVETGCGKSTIMFSNVSPHHTVFTLDDRNHGDNSSINFYETCELTKLDRVHVVFGPTQLTLPAYKEFKPYDVVLIDGPHGFPFPEIEYYYFYPHLREGGLLILDDTHIPTIGRLADVVAEDAMFELVELVSQTAVFRRTDAPTFDPLGDSWWTQQFNRRRIPRHIPYLSEFVLKDGLEIPPFAENYKPTLPGAVEGYIRTKAGKLFKRS